MTEKAISRQTANCYQFWVDRRASKNQIKAAIKEIFNVKPVSVKTILVKGKTKRLKKSNRLTFGPTKKKAIVEVPEGSKMGLAFSPKKK